MECVLLGGNFHFLGNYVVDVARYLVVTARYCSLLGGYWWLQLSTGDYCLLLLIPTFSMNTCDAILLLFQPPHKNSTKSQRYKGLIDAKVPGRKDQYSNGSINQHFLFARVSYESAKFRVQRAKNMLVCQRA